MDIFDDYNTADERSVLEVKHPATGLPLVMDGENPVRITLVGMDSERYRSSVRARTNKRLKAAADTVRSQVSAEMLESEALDLLAACTMGWTGIYVKGEAFAFSAENARQLYSRLPWLREQVDGFIADRANFLKASLAS